MFTRFSNGRPNLANWKKLENMVGTNSILDRLLIRRQAKHTTHKDTIPTLFTARLVLEAFDLI